MIATVKAPNTPNTEKEQYNNINFRFVHGLAIPYIEIHIPDKKRLKALTVSPRIGLNSNDVDTIESVRTCLKYLGYTHKIDILCSEIPLRYY